MNWFKYAKRCESTKTIENVDFVNTFNKTFVSKIKDLSKN